MNKMQYARKLFEIGALTITAGRPFVWSSGIESPVYCDNRLIMSDPEFRKQTTAGLVKQIVSHYPQANVVCGAATGGIPHAAWVSERLSWPMIYVRGKKKDYGRKKQIEGAVKKGDRVVVVEDLISTGNSALQVARALQEEGVFVEGVVAIFSYDLPAAAENFAAHGISCTTLTDFPAFLADAKNRCWLEAPVYEKLVKWHENLQKKGTFKNDAKAWSRRI